MRGRVIKNISNQYDILAEGAIYSAKARGIFKHDKETIKVGDFVEFSDGVITKIHERKNTFIRPQISNVDNILIVTSLKRPDINYNLLDEFIINVLSEDVNPILIFTKVDLLTEEELKEELKSIRYYEKYYDVFLADYEGIKNKEKFIELINGKTLVISGQTGAGKSHLLNTLNPNLMLKTQDISEALGRGKHTTRHTELLNIEGALIADSPGFSSLDLTYIKETNLKEYYPEFVERLNTCKYNECMHIKEPSCAIKKAVEDGEILKSRYESYVKFYTELKENPKNYKRS